jgi:hypothetical protein
LIVSRSTGDGGHSDGAETDRPDWIAPGERATLIWYEAAQRAPDGTGIYQVSGPVLERAPTSPYFLLAPLQKSEFADRLYRNEATLAELRDFLDQCVLAEGWISDALDCVFTRAQARPLALLDAWRVSERPLVPYRADLEAFLCDDLPVFVSPSAHAAAQGAAESFATASVCSGCGQAEDAAVFFWTAPSPGRVRVCLLIENEGGRWTCRFHPFEFERKDP